MWKRGPLKILNGMKWILNDLGELVRLIYNQFGIFQVLLRTSNWSGTFFCCFLQQTESSIANFHLRNETRLIIFNLIIHHKIAPQNQLKFIRLYFILHICRFSTVSLAIFSPYLQKSLITTTSTHQTADIKLPQLHSN